ncbi:FAD-dependent oxidoreductase [Streptomyces lushanensis]|uniref:FAD-dependent oxidoreductase n=1 Tax=Streptomyces lushanensis TaxID=1434255 RepID=UPI00082AAE5F|nr:FAD-binding protein [Streptomyces lushanensis]
MTGVNRRTVLTGSAAALGGTALAGTLPRPAGAAPAPAAATVADIATVADAATGATVFPDDPRYPLLTTGNNQRFVSRPDYIRMIRSTADAERALKEAVRRDKRVSLRSGGHCFADFVCHGDVEVVLDFSEMTDVSYDPRMRAFAVEPGARLMNVYEALYKGWGVTIPGGICYSVGAGGHIAGGGYGLLSRAHGLVVDHLYAVEVVTVSASGNVRTVVASREPDDPNRDLWWAHSGGGGGNFGLVTRYWFRSPGARGDNPAELLVQPPSTVLVSAISFPWEGLSERQFSRLLKNFGAWHEANSAPDSPYTALSSLFNVCHTSHGTLDMFTQVDATVPDAERLLADYVSAITAGTGLSGRAMTRPSGELTAMPQLAAPRLMPWLQATRLVGANNPTITDPTSRGAHKSAYMRKNFSDHQVSVMYRHMSDENYPNPDTMIVLFSFGGQVNAVPEDATANAQRSSVFKMCFQTFWPDESGDAAALGWARGIYEDFFSATGGVPVPNENQDGCYINYPDTDVADSRRNLSGVPWTTLYYKNNYAKLQQVKRRWDPSDFFHHSLSIRPAR